ncbi:MAG: AAA family ATPase [Rhodomicrobiaceae bacterium]
MNDFNHYHQRQSHISIADVLVFFKKQAWVIGLCVIVGVVLGFVRAASLEPRFTAQAQILIDTRGVKTIEDSSGPSEAAIDPARVEGKIAILQSETIAGAVIEKLDLKNDPEFQAPSPSLTARLGDWVKALLEESPSPQTDGELDEFIKSRVAISIFQGNLQVRRVGTSYAIGITFTSVDPQKAAHIANAVADAYIEDQIRTASDAARRTSIWLEKRIDEARGHLNEAARAVQLFRAGQTIRGPLAGRVGQPDPATGVSVLDGALPGQDGAALDPATASSVTLAELESRSQHYQKVYETYLQAFTNSLNRESLPVSDSRIITRATRPLLKSSPRTKLILAFGAAIGLLVGVGFAFLRYNMDNSVQSSRQLRERLGIPVLAEVPRLEKGDAPEKRLRIVKFAPFTGFTSSLKLVRNSLISGSSGRVRTIGVTSVLPGEGKTTIAANMAALLSTSGKRVLLIDVDLHQATVTKFLAPNSRIGILDVLSGKQTLKDAVVKARENHPDILPQNARTDIYSYEAFCSKAMQDLLDEAKKSYDYVIIDMPPLGPVVDGLEMSAQFDGVVIIAEWGKTPIAVIEEASQALRAARARILGAVITKVDPMLDRSWKKDWSQYYGSRETLVARS